ncbi:unnamed protein product [Rotaria sordida]|uniref:Condensin complex subunit 1 n=1 Tax=Rotaria sordida TaxID=392033 RepID=A0A819JCS3_9BILA|nr:unnamed protein product [Rotaria sordida]
MATFIIDMARLDPHIIRIHIDQITDLLTAESHHIHVAALTAFCSVIEKLLLSDDLDDGQRKMRSDLLQILREHVSDVTAFVRQHCLQLWTSIVQQKKDSTCAVRKDAVTLIMHMVLNNFYFVINSTRVQFEERQNDAETKLDELRTELEKLNKNKNEEKKIEKKIQSDDDDEDKSINDENEMKVNNNQEEESEKNNSNEDQSLEDTLNRVKIEEQIMRVEEIVILYKDGLRFMDLIEQANRHVVNLLNSPTLGDCKQVVDFFVNLRRYRLVLANIEQSLRLMFSLIWSLDKSICEAITQAFVKVYFDVAPTVPPPRISLHQARAIIHALKGATLFEELCFEEILKQLIKGKKIATEPITKALWKFYKAPSDDNTCVIAEKILSFIVGNEVSSKLNHITDLIQAKEKNRRFIENGIRPKQFRLPKIHRLFKILANILVSNGGNNNDQNQLSQHHSQTNENSALISVEIVYYVDCTIKDELLRRKEAKQSFSDNKKLQQKTNKSNKKRTKCKTLDEDDENQSTSINDTINNSLNLTGKFKYFK